ncbi:metal-dependent hydrolase [Natronorubrum aibiense]|uniref:Hydrolase n=1 Tax=Natronorubrum aibiense TaxID=348826 RepID=A0A5P9P6G1_9EURY|nr:metal-dependent hydrolase [Natronorubrum aibiense]QFU83722.1 hydrolase [Natronorubrum aibiense]
MFVGHALFAFAVAALVADWRGWERRPALLVGAVAGAFATIPDLDVAYALVGLLEWRALGGDLGAPAAFWGASRVVHRSVTHSLVVGAVAASAFGFLAVRVRSQSGRARVAHIAGLSILATLVGVALVWSGPLAAFVMALFAVGGIVVTRGTARLSRLAPSTVAIAALWGLWSHPWGDLLTGSPPDWLFPFGAPVLESRLVLHPDPTLHLLGAFAVELATVWFALAVGYRLTGRSILTSVDRRAAVGAVYGVAALAVTPPTLEVSYHFVFSILGVGLLCSVAPETASLVRPRSRLRSRVVPAFESTLEVALTALAAVTIALFAYLAVYLVAVPT